MKLEKYVKVIDFNQEKILCNTINKSIVTIKEDMIKKGNLLTDKFKREEIDYLENNGFINNIFNKNNFNDNLKIPTTIIINITENCNINCLYCYQNNFHSKNSVISKNTVKFVLKYVNKIIDLGQKEFYIYFFGGEPLIFKEKIVYIKRLLDEVALKKSVSIKYGLGSNSILLSENFLNEFESLNIDTTLTLDNDHNFMRPCKYTKNTHRIIIENLSKANKKENINIHIGYNTHKNNLKEFDKFLYLLKSYGLNNVNVSIDYIDNYKFNSFHNDLSIGDFLRWKSSVGLELLINNGFYIYDSPFYSSSNLCNAHDKYSIKFFSDGSVGPCNYTSYNDRIKNPTIENILNLKKELYDIGKSSKEHFGCINCSDYGICRGLIYCNNYKCSTNNAYDFNYYIKEYVKQVRKGNSKFFLDM